MTISKDLFLSILAMDAYNRGYDAGIADNGFHATSHSDDDSTIDGPDAKKTLSFLGTPIPRHRSDPRLFF